MANVFRSSQDSGGIFKNESALLPDFLPEELPGREKEIKELVFCLKPASENRQPQHALLVGPPGSGKTAVSRFLLKQLAECSQRPLPVYLNCWEAPSRFAILSSLVSSVGEVMPRRGIASDELLSRFVEIAKKEGRIPIIVLDEVDRLLAEEGGEQILYDLCRASELHSLKTGVIAITNDEELHIRLDSRIRSSFLQHTIKFAPYSVPQLKEILSQRARLAFFPDALGEDVVPFCAAVAFKLGGDARAALSLLLSAGKAAEQENSKKVSVEHVRKIRDEAMAHATVKAERKLGLLDKLDRQIVKVVKKAGKGGIESGKIYDSLMGVAKDRAIRSRIDKLVEEGILVAQEVRLGVGRTRVIRLKS
ncbi:MAG: AAA family ATPase [Candidatus Micrarchaeota archaeon]|nr:AAA family ATPase [Candidatus Micrarchaeota archaeon]